MTQRVRAVERQPTRQHLVSDDPQRPEVRTRIHHVSTGLFGRHVGGCAHRTAGTRELGCRLPALDLCEAEVQHFQLSRGRQHQIRRFQIPVNDVGGVCGF